MTYWPGTGIRKSQANDFTLRMWTSQEQARAETLKRQAKETTAYTPLSLIGYSKPRRSRK